MNRLVDIFRGFKRKPEPPRLCSADNIDALLNRPHPETIRETWVKDNAPTTSQQ